MNRRMISLTPVLVCLSTRMPAGMKVLPTLVIDGQTYAPGASGDKLIIPLMPGEHAFEVRALEQPPVFRNWQAWDRWKGLE
jgi:hypothetical protein